MVAELSARTRSRNGAGNICSSFDSAAHRRLVVAGMLVRAGLRLAEAYRHRPPPTLARG